MANQRKIIGKIPVYRGNWSSSNAPYHKLNDVTLYGCMFRSKIENNSYQPATIGAGGELVVNENWYLVTSGYESEAIKEELAFIDNNTNAYNVSRFHSHTGFWEAIEYDESQPAYIEAQQYSAGSKVNLVNYTNHTFVAMKSLTGVQPDINTVTNKFTLEEAVLLVPKKYQLSGIKIGFISSETNKPVFHRYNGGTFTSVGSWTGDTFEKLTELDIKLGNNIILESIEVNPITGKAISTTGQLVSNPNVSYAEIDTKNLQKIDIYTYINKGLGNIAYYDIDDNVLSVAVPSNEVAVYGHVYLDKPVDAVKARVCWPTSKDYTIKVSKERLVYSSELSKYRKTSDDGCLNMQVFTDNLLANSIIKELYLCKSNGESITNDLFIIKIVNDTTYSGQTNISSIVISDGINNVSAIYQSEAIPSNEIVKFTERGGSGIIGYAVLDMNNLEKGDYNLNAKIKKTAYNYTFNPYIYSHFGIAKNAEDKDDIYSKLYEVAKDVTLTKDKYLKNDGITEVDLANFFIEEIPVKDVIKIMVSGTHFSLGCTLCFKNDSGDIIGDIITVGETIYSTVEKYVPIGATKAFTSYRNMATLNEIPYTKVVYNYNLNPEKYDFFSDVTNDIDLIPGSANQADGTPSTIGGNAWAKTDKKDISKYDFVKIYDRITNSICYVKWYNNEDEEVLPRGVGDSSNIWKYKKFYKPEGATKAEISVIDYQSKKIIVELGEINKKEFSDNNGLLQQIDLRNIPNVIMIPVFGQSLSVGAAATPVISKQSKYPGAIMFSTGIEAAQKDVSYFTEFVPLQERERGMTEDSAGTGETVASGCAEKIIELLQSKNGINCYSNFWANHKILFVTCGAGSKTIAQLMTDYYQGLINSVQGGKNVANSKEWNLFVPAVIYIQGETDQKSETTDLATYKKALIDFANKFNTDVKNITQQTQDVKVIMYQTCSQNIVSTIKYPTFTNTAMDIPTAQMELVRDNDMFVACNPAYILDHSDKEMIHLTAVGEKMMGAYCGISLYSILLRDRKIIGLTPNSFSVDGNNIKVKYNVPVPPLQFNTSFVKEVENKGFAVLNSSDNDIIKNVSVYDDEITIECTENPFGCKLYYGFNGTASRDGRKEGSRGNLCDNADKIYNAKIDNKEYALSNYSYSFCILVE